MKVSKSHPVPAALAGRIEPQISLSEVRKRILLDRALHPARRLVSRDEFEQIVYDTLARNRSMCRAQVVAWARHHFEVSDASNKAVG